VNDLTAVGVRPINVGQLWQWKGEGPFRTMDPILVLDVKEGWVLYRPLNGSSKFQRSEEQFRQAFEDAGDKVERDAEEVLRERFERFARDHNWPLDRSLRYPSQYACNYTQYGFGAFIAAARGEYPT